VATAIVTVAAEKESAPAANAPGSSSNATGNRNNRSTDLRW
jgi:hypothetical protein